jgi:predicted restriction endonuclease
VPNKPVRFDDAAQQAALHSMFSRTQVDIAAPLVGIEVAYDHRDTDERQRAVRAVVNRYGQPRFREDLLVAYNRSCAISGCTAVPVLEAAHIDPYLGAHTQHVTNGLLLRSDLHTLFDLHLITVTAGIRVAIAPELRASEYSIFDQRELMMPVRPETRPDAAAVERHRARCDWYTAAQ